MSIESMMSSNPLFFCCPLLLLPSILPSIRVFSKVLGRQLHRGVSSPAYRKKRKGQSALLEPVIFQVPLAQKKKQKKNLTKMAYFVFDIFCTLQGLCD